MSIAIVTGAAGLIGSEATRYFANKGLNVIGIDNDMRAKFFGQEASTQWQRRQLKTELGNNYKHVAGDIRDQALINRIFRDVGADISLIIHAAAQPSHDWAARDPMTDFAINAVGTMNLLEATRHHAPNAPFIFTSSNKVYGDKPNQLPLHEMETRYEIDKRHEFRNGISEQMSIDDSTHSIFGASKVAADVMVQEYGRYFGLKTVSFRGGCLAGPNHSGAQLHGFLAYLMKCTVTRTPYTVFGYRGKQVRDNIHSHDLITAFDSFFENPRCGEVYNIGGGCISNCSMLEAIEICQRVAGEKLDYDYSDSNRIGDHLWWISDISKFKKHYPEWNLTRDIEDICREIFEYNVERWATPEVVAK